MMTHPCKTDMTKELTLSQSDAHMLLRLLEEFLSGFEGQADAVEDLYERLGDAFALARWQRENVTIPLAPVEVVDLLKAIVIMMEDRNWTEGEARALEVVCRQLSEMAFAPGLVAVGTRGPRVQFDRLELSVKEVDGCS